MIYFSVKRMFRMLFLVNNHFAEIFILKRHFCNTNITLNVKTKLNKNNKKKLKVFNKQQRAYISFYISLNLQVRIIKIKILRKNFQQIFRCDCQHKIIFSFILSYFWKVKCKYFNTAAADSLKFLQEIFLLLLHSTAGIRKGQIHTQNENFYEESMCKYQSLFPAFKQLY